MSEPVGEADASGALWGGRFSGGPAEAMASLSRSTVSEIVNEILPMGLVAEVGEGPSRGGRRPIVIEFQDDSCVILGVEMSATHVAVAFDHVIESFRNDVYPGYKTGAGVDESLLAQFPLAERAMRAIGVTVWSMVEFEADDALATLRPFAGLV